MPSGGLPGKGGEGPAAGAGPAQPDSPGSGGGIAPASAKLSGLLGLGARAGQVVSGATAVRKRLATGRVKLVVVATDAARRTAESFRYLAARQRVPVLYHGTQNELGRLLGEPPRSVVGILSEQLAREILAGRERGETGDDQKLNRR